MIDLTDAIDVIASVGSVNDRRSECDCLLNAAKEWWEGKRPCEWDETKHHDNPGVNCTTHRDLLLAEEISKLLRGA